MFQAVIISQLGRVVDVCTMPSLESLANEVIEAMEKEGFAIGDVIVEFSEVTLLPHLRLKSVTQHFIVENDDI